MKFFKPEDFYTKGDLDTMITPLAAAAKANAKLEHLGEVVYGNFGINNHNEITHKDRNPMHKALLLNVEQIEKCEHPIGTIYYYDEYMQGSFGKSFWQCGMCGINLIPTKFEEVK